VSDYVYLNKAKAHPIRIGGADRYFNENKKLCEAILALVNEVYLNHHKEEKDRRRKLVEFLDRQERKVVE
jgi:hypothetical protein